MLNSRNVILFSLTVAFLSILGTVVSLSLPPDGGGKRSDSYGTRRGGQRGLYELLEHLKIPVSRGMAPPSATMRDGSTLVLWGPLKGMVQYEPDHLKKVGEWVRNGGRLVLARESHLPGAFEMAMTGPRSTTPGQKDITEIEALGLTGVALSKFDIEEKSAERTQRMQNIKSSPLWEIPPPIERPTGTLEMKADGTFARLFPKPLTIFTPLEDIQVIEGKTERHPVGRLVHTQKDGVERVFAAEYEFGKGRVVLIGEPALFENYYMQSADNPVLAAHVFHALGQPVIFDEFYHGLTVRGNPFWLLTKHPFGLLFFVSFAAVAAFTVRQTVHLGPPLGERLPNRRTLAEYIGAMSHLFHRTGHFKFVLREVRNGTLWHVRRKLGLAPQHEEDVERIAAVLARKHPEQAQRLKAAVAEADEILSGKRPATGVMMLQAGRKLSECL